MSMQITMPRGDLRTQQFNVIDEDRRLYKGELFEIYVSFKKNFTDKKVLFQKSMSEGTVIMREPGIYEFAIEPEDTDPLEFGSYVFDIELIGDGIKQTSTGGLRLTEEATWADNE